MISRAAGAMALDYFRDSFVLVLLALLGIGIIYLLPRLNDKIPAPIIAIAVISRRYTSKVRISIC